MANYKYKLMAENPKEISKEMYNLNIKIRKLESGIDGYLGNGRNISNDIFNKCLTEMHDYTKMRVGEGDKLKRRLQDIKTKIKSLKKSLENLEPSEEHVAGVKDEMEGLESVIKELKHEQKDNYEALLRYELSLWQECVFMEKKIDSWESGDQENTSGKIQKVSKVSEMITESSRNNAPVVALQRFLDDSGGKTGGWSTLDHQTFLRIRLRYTNINIKEEISYPRDGDTFFKNLASLLAPKSISEIEAHEVWYQKYEELLIEKKRFICRWKEEKSKQEVKEVNIEEDEVLKTSGKSEWDKEKRRLEKQRQELDRWRADKVLEDYRLKMEKEQSEKEESDKRKKEEEKQRAETKQQVLFYKQKKIEEEAEKYELQLRFKEYEDEEKKKGLEQHSARISERNIRMVEEKILKKQQKKINEEMRQARLNQLRSKVAITAPRDPSRLLRPTSGWTQKISDVEGDRGLMISGAVKISNVQHKAVPSWRRDTP